MGASIAHHARDRRHAATRRFFDALIEALDGVAGAPSPVRRLARLASSIDLTNNWPDTLACGTRLPICRCWRGALRTTPRTPAAALARALGALGPLLAWTQNPNYRRRPPTASFLDNYGYAVIAGPADGPPALVVNETLALGVLLLAPGTHYPLHAHPATELYYTLSGGSEFWRDAGPWRVTPAGATIYHAPAMPHAMRARRAPLLAIYLWRGELATHARLVASRQRRGCRRTTSVV